MKIKHRPSLMAGAGADLAFAMVVLIAYFVTFSSVESTPVINIYLMVILGIAYISIGIYGYGFCFRSKDNRYKYLYFMVQIPLGSLILFFSGGSGFNALLFLPLAAHSVVLFHSSLGILINLVLFIAYVVSVSLSNGVTTLWAGLPSFIAGQVFVIVFTQMALSEEKAREEVEKLVNELASANQRLREFATQVEDLTIARERNRLAREIHDGLGHYLTTIYMQIQAAIAIVKRNPQKSLEVLSSAQGLTQEALTDVRQSVAALRSTIDDNLTLPDKIAKVIKGYEVIGMDTELIILGSVRPLSSQLDVLLFRTVQEALSNVGKHSRATAIWITLDYRKKDAIRLVVKDNGSGSETLEGGFGLPGLQERVYILGGKIQINTAIGEGLELEIVMPG